MQGIDEPRKPYRGYVSSEQGYALADIVETQVKIQAWLNRCVLEFERGMLAGMNGSKQAKGESFQNDSIYLHSDKIPMIYDCPIIGYYRAKTTLFKGNLLVAVKN